MKLVFATNNPNKIREIQQILEKNNQLLSLNDIGCHEDIPEEQDTIEGNASQKAFYVYDKYNKNCFADDTGLEVEVLNNAPGVYSARYAGKDCNPKKNIAKLLDQMQDKTNRKARFKTVISLVIEGKEYMFEGIVNGQILHTEKGSDGFGYDPVFLPDGYEKTFAEMTAEEKNKISHRAIAVNKLATFIKTYTT